MIDKPTVALDLDLTLANTLSTAADLLGAEKPITFESYKDCLGVA